MSNTASFFGDDWDDDAIPTLVRTPSMIDRGEIDPEETLEQRPANDLSGSLSGANKRPASGIWIKRDDAVEIFAIPLVVRWVDPIVIIEEMQLDPQPVIPVPNNTMDVLPWDMEVVEDSVALQHMLRPPTWYAPMPVHPVRTPAPIPNAVLFAAALILGFACSALGCVAVLALFA